jgi:hypothetical protein
MELWIRSQDRENLKKINTGFYLRQDLSDYAKGEVIFIVSGGDKLGEYETKERALEILDEIQEHLDYLNIGKINRLDEKGFRVCTIYKMPKE